ncbi:hypothetical protein ZIOFF_047584 [Zingiber officinale]|uniref:aldehyde oxygenase (deformylating) n=1 Tax=Zingiber officinale TaxID=94328 RepID=A0A8J5KWV3_ZINOF|nr:hypothetical protein ZIOFF_047584 [Zingiber officinale]
MHCKWGYEKIHRVHHEFTATIGFATPYAHWAEVLLLGIPSFARAAMVPCHMITFWLWIALRQLERLVQRYTSARFGSYSAGEELIEEESKLLTDYVYHTLAAKASGELCLKYIFSFGAFARKPLLERMLEKVDMEESASEKEESNEILQVEDFDGA